MAYRPAPIGAKRLSISEAAQRDIDEHVFFRADTTGMGAALELAGKIESELARLAWIGHGGVSREQISPGLRLHVIDPFSIYFRTTPDETRIIRFVRGSQDISEIDFDTAE